MLCLRVLLPLAFILLSSLVIVRPVVLAGPHETSRADRFVKAHESKLRPLEVEASRAWWDANTTGKDEDFKRKEKAQNRIDEELANPVAFKFVKTIRDEGGIENPQVAREIELLY